MSVDPVRLTVKQAEAMRWLAEDGGWLGFGSGTGRYRVALRALRLRAPDLVEYWAADAGERFRITDAGRALLRNRGRT